MNQNNIVDIIDVEQRHYQTIKEILARFLPYKKVIAYGSRVKWNASETSDLDLVVFNATDKQIYNAKEAFDESNIPFIVQILNWETIPQDFKENIEQKCHILQKEDDWGIFRLGEVADVRDGTHDSPKQKEQGKFLITSKHIKNNKIDFSNAYKISLEDFDAVNKRSKVDQWDILFSMIGTIGEMTIVSDDSPDFAIKNIGLFKTGDKELSQWIYYYLQSTQGKNEINASLKGSTQQYITLGDLRNFPIHLPPLAEQKTIAEILSSLDDKIDLLHRQNKTLEEIAETLFRHYFIDNAKDDWEAGKLGDLVDCYNGVSYKGADLENSENALITLKSFNRDGSFSLNGFKEYTGKHKEQHIAEEKDLIVAHTDITQDAAIIGNPVLVYKPEKYKKLLFTMDTVKVKSRFNWLSNEVLYLLMKTTEFKEHCLGYSNGSTVLHLSKKAIPEFEFSLPPQEVIEKNSHFLKDYISKVFSNTKQIQTLEKLRDTLLPKLISGEIRINYHDN